MKYEIYICRYIIYINAIMETMCPSVYHHNGFVVPFCFATFC